VTINFAEKSDNEEINMQAPFQH